MSDRELTGLRGRDRGQTTQDFAVGISVFLLTVTFAFWFVPSTVTPFGSTVTDAIPEKADRVAATIVDTYGGDEESRNLSIVDFNAEIAGKSGDVLREEFGLRSTAQVNVTIQNFDGEIMTNSSGGNLAAGESYDSGTVAATTTRVVQLDVDGCRTGCLLVVRVW